MCLKTLFDTAKEFGNGFSERKIAMYAASSTYNIFMATAPVIMLMVSLIQFLPINENDILERLAEWMPEQVMSVVQRIIIGIYSGGKTAFTVSVILTVFSASAAMRAIMKGIDSAYNSNMKQNLIIFYARSILYMVVFVAVLLLSFVIMAYGASIMKLISNLLPQMKGLNALFAILRYTRYLLVMIILYVVFLLMYRFIPMKKVKLHDQHAGAVFCASAWVLFSFAFSFYISHSNKFGAYGYIGTIMVAMLWLYYCILFLMLGGWMNSFIKMKKETKLVKQETFKK